MRKRTSRLETFSISFLDCICCGFGAVLLLFVLSAGKRETDRQQQLSTVRDTIGQLEADVTTRRERVEELARRSATEEEARRELEARTSSEAQRLLTLEQQLALLLQEQAALEDERKRLIAEKQAIPTVEAPPPVPIPNVQRRQYLTGFQLEGETFVLLVRASGSMVADTVEEAVALQGGPDAARREAPKWQRVLRSIEWLIASLPEGARFQVLLFAENTLPLIAEEPDRWFNRDDRRDVRLVLERLQQVVPRGGANLERAFRTVRQLSVVPNSVLLLTDGLPTQSDTYPGGSVVTDSDRVRYFRAALGILPRDIPINTILYPLSGDPVSPFLFWQLAADTRGALVSPAPSWPDT